jgi:hypothetical protein
MTQPGPKVLSTEQLTEVLRLLGGADSAELKLSVPDRDRRSAVASLGLDPLGAQLRQVVFFDTPELTLEQHGLIVRARRVQGKPGDSVVKLRPVDPARVPPAQRRRRGFGIEVDAMPGGFQCSASLKAPLERVDVRDVLNGAQPIRKLFTKEQRAFYATHAPAGVELDDLTALGPILVLKLKFTPEGFARRLTAELWLYPDGGRILELSTKCAPAEAFLAAAEARAYLGGHGIDLEAEQATKTRTALEFFAGELAGATAAG